VIRSTSPRIVALLLAVLAAGCGATSGAPSGVEEGSSGREASEVEEGRRLVTKPETPSDGTVTEPAAGFGSRPPSWLGTRELPRAESGYGEVRPNPYVKGDVVLPELASSYLGRAEIRPGMIVAAGPVIEAFARVGWEWGGHWNESLDFQHFSQNGR
jgi:hypothetical protein